MQSHGGLLKESRRAKHSPRYGRGSPGRGGEGLAAGAGQEAPRGAPDRPGKGSRRKPGWHEADTEETQRP